MSFVFQTFKTIKKPTYELPRDQIMETEYRSPNSLEGKFITRSTRDGFRVYPNKEEFMKHFDTMPEADRCLHEVIFGKQRIKFDIDAKTDAINTITDTPLEDNIEIILKQLGLSISSTKTKYNKILATIICAIQDTFFLVYNRIVENLIICESIDVNERKFSNHVIIPGYYVTSCAQAKEFTRRVFAIMPKDLHQFVDIGVNKRPQNFRLINCHKDDDARTKRLLSNHRPEDTFISNIDGCKELPDISAPLAIAEHILHNVDVEQVINICKRGGIMDHNRFKCVSDGIFMFDRESPELCTFCNREHAKDNTVFVTTSTWRDGTIAVYHQCRKYLDEHGRDGNHYIILEKFLAENAPDTNIIDVDPSDFSNKPLNWIDRKIEQCITAEMPNQITQFESMKAKNIYTAPQLRPFELCDTLIVRAAMKMGKTKNLINYINEHFNDGLTKNIIRFVSFRQTFSANIKERFPDFVLYSDVKGRLDQDKLIVQVESLHRLDIREGTERPDLLILDECESIFEQFNSGLLRSNFADCFAKFQYLMEHSKHVICMDANVSDRTYNLLKSMRGQFESAVSKGHSSISAGGNISTAIYHCNQHRNACDDMYTITGDKAKWLYMLHNCVKVGEKIAVAISSFAEAKALAHNLTEKFPQSRLKIYSSETMSSEKQVHFADVAKYWGQLDILIYTPTVSAGISFELKHFHKVFGYFTDQSCPVETCTQMMGRVRDVGHKQYHLYLHARGNNMPETIDAIKQNIITKRHNLNYENAGLVINYGADGRAAVHAGPYFQLFAENLRMVNLSKNSFIRRFINTLRNTGGNVQLLTDELFGTITNTTGQDASAVTSDILAEHNLAKANITNIESKIIAESVELEPEEADAISNLLSQQADVTPEQRAAHDKFRLRSDYKYGHKISPQFVIKYHDIKTRRIFNNLSRIYIKNPPVDNAIGHVLERLRLEELAQHQNLINLGYFHYDLNRKYVYDQHRYALRLLEICGWKSIDDPAYMAAVTLAANLKTGEEAILNTIKAICQEFNFRAPARCRNAATSQEYIHHALIPIVRVLSIMYGVRIGNSKNDPHLYSIKQSNMFTTCARTSEEKSIPLIRELV